LSSENESDVNINYENRKISIRFTVNDLLFKIEDMQISLTK